MVCWDNTPPPSFPADPLTGLGSRLETWMLERGYTPRYKRLGIAKPGEGGGLEQVGFHGLEPEHLVAAVKELVR